MENTNDFNLPLLWEKIKENAKRYGRNAAKQALLMYYVLKSDETPRGAKVLIFISSKRHPILGWADEIAAIALAYRKGRQYVTPDMERQADETLNKWF